MTSYPMPILLALPLALCLRAEDASRLPQPPDIDALIRELGANDYVARQQAETSLRALGFPAFAKLRAAFDGPDAEAAMRARKIIGDHDEILKLLDALPRNWHTTLYYDSLTETQEALVWHGAVLVPYLEDRFKRETLPLYRFNCITILDKFRTPEALALLRKLAKDEHPWCRTESVWALGNAEDKESLALLAEAFAKDADANVRKEALAAMGKVAGLRIFVLEPDGIYEFDADRFLTDEARAEVRRVVEHFQAHKKFPEMESLRKEDGARIDWRGGKTAGLPADPAGLTGDKFKGDWKVKSFKPFASPGCWIFVRLEKDSRAIRALGCSPFRSRTRQITSP